MGTWGYKTFENDGASDWLYDLEEAQAIDFILKPIKAVNKARGKADLDDSLEALAAAEVIAGARYEPPQGVPPIATKWIRRTGFTPNDATVKLALRAIGKVVAASELADVWQEAEKLNAWHKAVKQLNRRLTISLQAKVPKRASKLIAPRQTLAEFIIEVAASPTSEKRAALRKKLTELEEPNHAVGGRRLPTLSPLHWLAAQGFVEEAKLLVARGAITGGDLISNALPRRFALKNKHYAMVDCLIQSGANTDYALLRIVQDDEIKIAEKLVRAGASLRWKHSGDCTLLHFAAMSGATKSIRWLLKHGLDINARDCIGDTPLHCAARKAHLAAVKVLIKRGANVYAKNEDGDTPLDEAIKCERKPIIRFLRQLKGE